MAPECVFPNIGPYGIEIAKLPRTAVSIFGFDIYWYGVLIVAGIVAGLLAAVVEAKRTGQDPGIYVDFLFYVLIACFIGLRAYYVAFSWDYYKNDPAKIFAFRDGGLAIYGAVIAAYITAFVYTKVKKINFGVLGDTAAPGLILGQAIGRWGNFFNREAFGGYTDSIFAMRYLVSQASHTTDELLANTVASRGAEYIQVHPAFLYESIWNLAVFVFLTLFQRRKKLTGEVCTLYLVCYGFGRFFIEGLRVDQLMIGNQAVSRLFSVLIVLGGAAVFICRRLINGRKEA